VASLRCGPRAAQHTAARLGRPLALAGALALACARPPPTSHAALEAALGADGAPAALRVRLVFGAGADLDLFVSDPHAETVYFGHSPSESGGLLDADRRCGDPSPRVEEVRFASPLPGRYRVGVDWSGACAGGGGAPEPFVVEVVHAGRRTLERAEAPPDRFTPVVLEFEIE
jgi:hypothetical protein